VFPARSAYDARSNGAIPVAGSAARQAFFEKFFARQQPAGTR